MSAGTFSQRLVRANNRYSAPGLWARSALYAVNGLIGVAVLVRGTDPLLRGLPAATTGRKIASAVAIPLTALALSGTVTTLQKRAEGLGSGGGRLDSLEDEELLGLLVDNLPSLAFSTLSVAIRRDLFGQKRRHSILATSLVALRVAIYGEQVVRIADEMLWRRKVNRLNERAAAFFRKNSMHDPHRVL